MPAGAVVPSTHNLVLLPCRPPPQCGYQITNFVLDASFATATDVTRAFTSIAQCCTYCTSTKSFTYYNWAPNEGNLCQCLNL